MGAGTSIPSREYFQKKTISTSELMQKIFSWMLQEANLFDMYALASPSECKKYITFTNESLKTFFKTVRIAPSKDPLTGKIYFQKLSDLTKVPDRLTEKQLEQCTALSFFFVRILQIFAALSLSVLDTNIPISHAELDRLYLKEAIEKKKYIPYNQFRRAPFQQLEQDGGGREEELEALRRLAILTGSDFSKKSSAETSSPLLNRYLRSYDQKRYVLIDDDETTTIYIEKEGAKNGRIILKYNTRTKNDKPVAIAAKLNIVPLSASGQYSIELKPIEIQGGYSLSQVFATRQFKYNEEEKSIGPVLFKISNELSTDPTYNQQTLPRFLKTIFYTLSGKKVTDVDILKSDSIRKTIKDLPSDMPPGLQVKSVWDSLTRDPPIKAYCVARSMQLLSPEYIYKDLSSAARTSICNTGFVLSKKDIVPRPDSSIFETKSLLTLSLLFMDSLQKTVPKAKEETEKKYQDFLRTMRAVYEERTEFEEDNRVITEKLPRFCEDKGKGPLYTTDKALVQNIRNYIGKLLNRQLTHNAEVIRVLGKLFVISKEEPLVLQKDILEKGMPEIEKVAEEARILLQKYYSDCEITYREAVVEIARNKDKLSRSENGKLAVPVALPPKKIEP